MNKEELMIEIEVAVQKHDYTEFRELNQLLLKIHDFLDKVEIKTIPQFNAKVFFRGKKKQ
jgi:hypothetical protein